ncbi:MAG: Wadjet anti-phage system protein JetA family protein [Nitrososphaerales archaeon]
MNPQPAANPFDSLPPQLFNILGTGSFVNLQRHHMAVLLRIYDLAEFNRFGLTREIVLAEIVDYLGDAQAAAEVAASAAADGDAGLTGEKSLQEFASWLLRRLAESGWIEREQGADYTEYIILPDYAFTLLEAFRAIGQQRPREYTGQLYAAHQLITSEHEEFSPALAVTQAYESVRGLVRGLNELNQNIRRYTERVTKDKSVPELMRLQFDDYAPALGAAYHALKTSDHVSRYRRDIVDRLEAWLQDGDWLDRAAGDLALQRRVTPGQAEHEINHALRFIVEQLEGLDPLLTELDRRHTQYLRTSLRQVRYQMSSADGNFKERLISLAQGLARLQDEGVSALPENAPGPRQTPVRAPDDASFYTMPTARAPFAPAIITPPLLDPRDAEMLRSVALREIGSGITPQRIQQFVSRFFNGHLRLHAAELPPDFYADMQWAIFTLAYGHHPEVGYGVEAASGAPVEIGPYRVQPFVLVKRGNGHNVHN